MTSSKNAKQASKAFAIKAERERDKKQASLDYEAERIAAHANMARLRELRLAKERVDSEATTTHYNPGKHKIG